MFTRGTSRPSDRSGVAPAPFHEQQRPHFFSEADCHDIANRLARYANGGGYTLAAITSTWRGNVRWARNLVSTAGEVQDCHVVVSRDIGGAANTCVEINDITDEALVAAARRAERIAQLDTEHAESDLVTRYRLEQCTSPSLFFDATYQLDAERRAAAAQQLARSAADAGMLSAGYIEVSAHSTAFITSWGMARYFRWTQAQYSVTVRDPAGVGSGWAGVDWPDWAKIDGPTLSARALDKCLASRKPVAVEPGRYMTILEPQAVCDFVGQLIYNFPGREGQETVSGQPFYKSGLTEPPEGNVGSLGLSKIGERVVDERITISADPMDPELGFPPFQAEDLPVDANGTIQLTNDVFHPATWIEHGVLTQLPYNRFYAQTYLGRDTGLPNSGAFRMSGGNTSIEEMIATTKRGLLVTRFDQVQELVGKLFLYRGYTRDGLWLIENGKISKPVKNFMFVESVLFALNNVEQLGPAQRAFHPPSGTYAWENPRPVIVPSMKVRDFAFTALTDAI